MMKWNKKPQNRLHNRLNVELLSFWNDKKIKLFIFHNKNMWPNFGVQDRDADLFPRLTLHAIESSPRHTPIADYSVMRYSFSAWKDQLHDVKVLPRSAFSNFFACFLRNFAFHSPTSIQVSYFDSFFVFFNLNYLIILVRRSTIKKTLKT